MLAIIGFVLAIVAAILDLTGKHTNDITWLLIAAVALVCAEVAWGWNRGGRYARRG
jgi:heme A synthase